ncbi:MAG: hypothetical protein AAF845_05670 [Bacteroidota bacterium]
MTEPTAPEEESVPGSPSQIEATVNKNPTVIIGAGTPDTWRVHYGGGLALLGIQPGELVGQDPREAFYASGDASREAFVAVG